MQIFTKYFFNKYLNISGLINGLFRTAYFHNNVPLATLRYFHRIAMPSPIPFHGCVFQNFIKNHPISVLYCFVVFTCGHLNPRLKWDC